MSTSRILRPNDWEIGTRVGVYVVLFGAILSGSCSSAHAVVAAVASAAWVAVAWPLWRQKLARRSWPDFCLHAVSWIFMPLWVTARVFDNDWGLAAMLLGSNILSALDVNRELLFRSSPTGEEA